MQSINVEHQLIEQNFWQEKMFWGAFHASRIEKEINSKPCCFESERELVFETGSTRFLSVYSGPHSVYGQNWLDWQK